MKSTTGPRVQQETVSRMNAITQDRYGSSEVLRPNRVDRPVISENDVLIRVAAAGVDRGTWHLMTGRPYLMRLIGFGFRRPRDSVAGIDVAGTVVAVGSSTDTFAIGDEVFGFSRGAFAEYAAVRADMIGLKPANCSFEQAAVTPISAGTALQAVRDAGHVEAGQQVLIIGASGGVGSFAVQLAKNAGAHVTGVCSTTKSEFVRSLGADAVLDYSRDDVTAGGRRYDLIIDIAGNAPLSRLRRALTATGTLVIVGGESKGTLTGGFERQLWALILNRFVRQRLVGLASKQRGSDVAVLAGLIEDGSVTPRVDRSYPLDQVPAALRYLESGGVRGKIAISV